MRFAYADPPYFGRCYFYRHDHGGNGRCWDDQATHLALVARLRDEFPDGWALSCSTPSLRWLLPACPDDIRVAAWTKPYSAGRRGVAPRYAWEPIIFRGGHAKAGGTYVVDFISAPFRTRAGLPGAKPAAVCRWILNMLGYVDGDELVDLFPGTGVMGSEAAQGRLALTPAAAADPLPVEWPA